MVRTFLLLCALTACRQLDAAPSPARSDAGIADATADAPRAPAPAPVGPTCTKGCPCGNACISCSKTCHVGAGTAKKRRR